MKQPLHALALALLVAAGIGLPDAYAQTRTDVAVAAPWHVSGIDPAQDGYTFQRMEVGETLVDADATGALRPGLATDWTVSDDGLTWRFDIRENVVFHDGSALDAAAAASSLNRAMTRPGILSSVPLEAIEADGNAVVVRLSEPFSAVPAVLANYTTMILAPASFDAEGNVVAFIGTGPFAVDKVETPLSLAVRRFDDYWGEAPAIEAASYLSASRAETRALMAESGDADVAVTLDPAGYAQLKRVDGIAVEAVSIPRSIVLKLNLARGPLADKAAREALSLAIDREGIAAGILRFPDAAATQLFPPVLKGWYDADLPPLAYDPERAAELLAGLGWEKGDDGILTRDGARFALTLRTFPNRPELPLIAAALQDQWRAIGVDLAVSVGNSSEIPAGHQDGSLDVALYARNYGLTPDPVVNTVDDFGTGGGDWGAMNWDAPEVAEALTAALRQSDPEARSAAIHTVASALQQELPVIPIAWYQHTVAYPVALEGLVVDPLERTYGLSAVRWAR
ncbi:ABC transporter substrate-binding protein [Acuticoccus mangrovi]|uniref:ABC transporter substrate-binding protein n=1 Tax=Acuticoccus mangrovi TaxID=2796142 RepID=A0A934IQ69_9HYPH|nr:ABC transporter substrate-binding protein [Acuticoccus mangrovi]MBJ3778052.1 ABC transporter substrate-binding protein [Acuticoccus mangrovi]